MKRAGEIRVIEVAGGWKLKGWGCARGNRLLERLGLRGLAPGSIRTYAFDLADSLRWFREQGIQPEELTTDRLYGFLKDHRDRLKPSTLNRRLRLLDRWARMDQPEAIEGITARRWPRKARRLPYVKEPRTIHRPLTDRQVRRVLESFKTHRDRAMAGLMWAMGLRIGEVLLLRLADLDWEQGTALVHGKGKRERSLPLPAAVGQLIRRYVELERPRACAEERVFVVLKGPRRGQALTYAGARRLFRYYRAILKLPEAHPHRFRHTFAANMIRQGLSLPMLMRLMGHTWVTTTLRYLHFDDRELREHYEKAMSRLAASGDGTATDGGSVL